MLWLQFTICAGLILIFGSRLSGYADQITKKGIFSASFMGVFFLAVITSCPEIFTSLGSITLVNAPNLAVGDLIGAVLINLCVITLLSIFYKKGSILAGQSRSNIFTSVLTILMLGFIIGFVSLRLATNLRLGLLNVGFDSIILGLIYLIGMGIIYKSETSMPKSITKSKLGISLWAKFIVSAVVIIGSGFWLARTGKAIADANGWNEMLVGLTLMAIATTMPEFIVSLSALRLNSVDMAVGNLIGSNFFNLFIITILDIFFRKGEFLSFVSILTVYPAFLAIVLISIVISRMCKKAK